MFHSRPTKKSRVAPVAPVAPVFSDTLPPFVLGMPLPGDFRGFFPQQQSSFFTGPNPFSPREPVTPRVVKRSLEEEEALAEPSAFKKRNIVTPPPFVLGMPSPGDFRNFFPQQQSCFFTSPNPFSPPGPVIPRIVKRSLEEEEEEILVEPSAFKKRNIAPERNVSPSPASPAAAAVPESTRELTPIVEEENLRVLKRSFEQMMGDNLDGDTSSRRVVHNGCSQQ